jgi:RND family efflux transporter MFP subunit
VHHRLAVGLALAALASSCGSCRRTEPAPQESDAAVTTPVQLYSVKAETIRATLGGPGTIVPAAARDWTIYAAEAGEIAELPKAEGDEVKTGDLLVRFQYTTVAADVMARQSDVAAAIARIDAAKAEVAKMSAMFDRGYTARNTLDQAKGTLAAAELDLGHAQQMLDIANATAERAAIHARFPGVVAKRFHNPGDLISALPTDPVLRVIDPTAIQVAITVSLQDLDRIQLGQTATVMSLTGTEPATVTSRPTPEDPRATTQEVRLTFTNPATSSSSPGSPTSPAPLAIDAPVQIEILLAEHQNVPVVPAAGIITGDGQPHVMTIDADGRAHRRDIRMGLTSRDRVEIIAGLSPGDRIVAADPAQVKEGTLVSAVR